MPNIDLSPVKKMKMGKFFLDCLNHVPEAARKCIPIPECQACSNKFTKDADLYHCSNGHCVCGGCKSKIENCPECRGPIIGRPHAFEHHLQQLL